MIWLVILNIWNGWYHPPVAKEPTYKLWDTYLHVLVCICCRTETETLSNNQNWFLLDQDYRKYRHTGYNFQEESRKNIFFLYIYSKIERWKWKNILPALLLKVVAGMPVFSVSWSSRNQFWLLLKVSVSAQPLPFIETFAMI